MAESTGLILAAAGIVAANQIIFEPAAKGVPIFDPNQTGKLSLPNFNWKLIPATAIAAVMLAGLEQLAPSFGKGLAGLALLSVLVLPVGNAPSPLENASKMLGVK
jgi:hypothetical protein